MALSVLPHLFPTVIAMHHDFIINIRLFANENLPQVVVDVARNEANLISK